MTVHVVTVHHRDARWIDPQLRLLRRHLPGAVVWASLEGVPEEHHGKFDRVVPSLGRHAGKLNLLAREVCAAGVGEDRIVFLDGDAMPIRPLNEQLESWLREHDLVAVQRLENAGDPQPHPCFAATTVSTWRERLGDWSEGHAWRNRSGRWITDVGGNVLREIERWSLSWRPLHRSNRVNPHPLFFGIYADVVYHHGSGFRRGRGRVVEDALAKRYAGIPLGLARRALARRAAAALDREVAKTSERLWSAACESDDFFRALEAEG